MFTWYFLQSLVQSAAWSVESDPSDLWKYKRLRYTYYLKYLLGHQKDIIACQLFKKAVLYFFICTVHCISVYSLTYCFKWYCHETGMYWIIIELEVCCFFLWQLFYIWKIRLSSSVIYKKELINHITLSILQDSFSHLRTLPPRYSVKGTVWRNLYPKFV